MQGPRTSSCPGRPGTGPCSGPMLWGLPLGPASRVDKGPGHLWNQASCGRVLSLQPCLCRQPLRVTRDPPGFVGCGVYPADFWGMGQLKLALNEAGPGAIQTPTHTHTHSVRPHVALSEPPLNILAVGSEGFCPLRRGRPLPPWAAEVRVPHGGQWLPSLTLLGPSGFIQFIILVAWTTRRDREGEETVRLLCCNLTSRMQLPGAPRPPPTPPSTPPAPPLSLPSPSQKSAPPRKFF